MTNFPLLIARSAFPVAALLLLSPGCAPTCEEVDQPLPPHEDAGASESVSVGGMSWTRWTVDAGACGAAFVKVDDLDQDGEAELVVSRLGKRGTVPYGEVTVYDREGEGLGSWARRPVVSRADELRFTAKVGIADVDDDGDRDVVASAGFFVCSVVPGIADCGGLVWFENEGDGFVGNDVVPPEQTDFYHEALLEDVDGDGVLDLLSVAEQDEFTAGDGGRAELQLFRGTGAGFETTPEVLAQGLGTIPRLGDVDGDGDMDVYGAEFFRTGGSFAWIERVEAPTADHAGAWQRHVIDDEVGRSIDLELVPGLMGDGRVFAVGSNHTNPVRDEEDPESNVFLYERPTDPREPWMRTPLGEGIVAEDARGQFAPGVIGTGDADGDGDIDLLISGDGDPRVFLFEQVDGGFVQHVLEPELAQAGGMVMADLTGDGALEMIVTGYEEDVIYVYEREN